jgi:hypothetical protein
MVAPLNEGKEITIGVGRYLRTGGWLNSFARWETMHSFSQYAAYTLHGYPYMAVGRNMAATRASVHAAQTSGAWQKLPSGDDDLLVNAAGNKANTALVVDKDAFTLSPAKTSVGDYIRQKQRHLSTGKYYKTGAILALGCYACSHALMWLSFFVLLLLGEWEVSLIGIGGRCLAYYLHWQFVAKTLDERFSWISFFLSDIGWMVYNFAFSPYIIWKNKKQWT